MELTAESLERIVGQKMGASLKGRYPSSTTENKDEILSCLYFRISRHMDEFKLSHNDLISICDKVFNDFEVHINYDKEKHLNSTLDQFEHIKMPAIAGMEAFVDRLLELQY